MFAAILLQFVGSEIIFTEVEETRIERGRSQRLADWLLFANEFIDTRPDAAARMNVMWAPRLRVVQHDAPPKPEHESLSLDPEIAQRVVASQPGLAPLDFRAARDGDALHGTIRLSNGNWLSFRSEDYFRGYSLFYHYTASALLLLLSVVVLALLFGRMISRPLAHIASAAEQVGRDTPVALNTSGPREVRQVAAAFDRMQTRLLDHVTERVQSLAAMSHDLRTPLARLRLNASTVDERETRDALEQDIAEMEAFVTSILDFLRGDEPEQEQSVDIASIAITVIDDARDAGDEASYEGPDRLEALTRPLKLKRLLRNILQNGVRHAGGAHMTLLREADHVTIRVDDDGPGIPPDRIEAVFKPFTRVETSRSRNTGGAGLGLTIADQLSQRLGGTITLTNRPGGGLSVLIRLPLNRPAVENKSH